MNRADVKKLIIHKGVSISILANELDVTPQAVYYVLRGHITSHRIESALEEILGHPIDQLRQGWRNIIPKQKSRDEVRAIIGRVNEAHNFPAAANM